MKFVWLLLLALCLTTPVLAQDALREAVQKGTSAYEVQDYDTAVHWFEKATQLQADSFLAWWSLAQARRANLDLPGAEAAYHEALKHTPEPWRVQLLLAAIKNDQSDYEAGADWARLVLKKRPDDLEARLVLADSQVGLGDVKAALDNYAGLLAAEPENLRVRFAKLRLLLDEQEHTLAQAEIDKIQDLDRGSLLAKALQLELENQEATWPDYGRLADDYRKLVAIQPDFTEALLGLGRALHWQGLDREAGPALETAARLGKKGSRPWVVYQRFERDHRSDLEPLYTHYRDSDSNGVDRYALGWSGDLDLQNRVGVDFQHVYAFQDSTQLGGQADLARVWWSSQVSAELGLDAQFGVVSTDSGPSRPVGGLNWRLSPTDSTRIGLGYEHQALVQTSQLIRNRVDADNLALSLNQGLPGNNQLLLGYTLTGYSDSNQRNAYYAGFFHRLPETGQDLQIGLTHRFLNNSRPDIYSGYFNPARFQVTEVVFSLRQPQTEDRWIYGAELAAGSQTVNDGQNQFVYRVGANLGYRIDQNFELELSHLNSTAALGTLSAAGFAYQETTFRLKFRY